MQGEAEDQQSRLSHGKSILSLPGGSQANEAFSRFGGSPTVRKVPGCIEMRDGLPWDRVSSHASQGHMAFALTSAKPFVTVLTRPGSLDRRMLWLFEIGSAANGWLAFNARPALVRCRISTTAESSRNQVIEWGWPRRSTRERTLCDCRLSRRGDPESCHVPPAEPNGHARIAGMDSASNPPGDHPSRSP